MSADHPPPTPHDQCSNLKHFVSAATTRKLFTTEIGKELKQSIFTYVDEPSFWQASKS
jgi:hypothetical protein